MRVAIFNVRFSPNLGDGLLAECLEKQLAKNIENLNVESIDLAGRERYDSGPSGRELKLKILQKLPRSLRQIVSLAALSLLARTKLRPMWRRRIIGLDAAIVGGGNLFADSDLNFPIKISSALAELKRLSIPVAIFGVGVTGGWSNLATRFFGSSLRSARLVSASVRDAMSQSMWKNSLSSWGVVDATIVCDPGLLASDHYPRARREIGQRRVGFCITAPLAVRYHGESESYAVGLEEWYGNAAAALSEVGWDVHLFTNGSPEDRACLASLGAHWRERSPQLKIVEDFAVPGDLASFAGACDLLIAHRMHACIAAYSFGVPVIGLTWDRKLNSFFELIDREAYIIDPSKIDVDSLVALAQEAQNEGIDAALHSSLLARGRADVARLATILMQAAAPS
jgi:polysaccharide pyruvyl transferase WcaK-like protein